MHARRPHADRPPTRPLERWLAAQSRRRRAAAASVVLLAVGASVAAGLRVRPRPAHELDRVQVTLIAVEADHRLRVRIDDNTPPRTIRLLGVADGGPRANPIGWLPAGSRLTLTAGDAEAAGVYAYTEAGVLINERLISDGRVAADAGCAHPLAAWFARIEGFAQRSRRGIWADPPPPGS